MPILAKQFGASGIQLSLLTILAIIPAIIISRLAGDLFPRTIGIKATLTIGFALSALLCIVMPWIPSLGLLYFVQFLSGISRSMVFPLLMGMCIDGVSPDQRATSMGTFQALYGIGMVFGPLLLGLIAQSFGLVVGFGFTGLVGLFSLFIIKSLSS